MNALLLPTTCTPAFASAPVISSANPSPKKSFDLSPLKFARGKTAIDLSDDDPPANRKFFLRYMPATITTSSAMAPMIHALEDRDLVACTARVVADDAEFNELRISSALA